MVYGGKTPAMFLLPGIKGKSLDDDPEKSIGGRLIMRHPYILL